ncbi:hypothetical protein AX16_010185 [Volvariella volvacea WC 439]|nr:hypothetical protein AX16_010185 [Volvariella volvacea WC 439]
MPLGVNPHFLLDDTQIVPRRNVFKYEEESSDMKPDDELLGSLHGIIRESLDVDWSLVHDYEGSTKRKRRKAKHDSAGGEQMEFEFRLLSTVQTISLLHKPPPPAKFREPSYEDTEEQAELRRKMAEQVAVDVAWLQKAAQRESKVWLI